MIVTKNLGMLFLAVYLLLVGLMSFIPALAGLGMVVSLVAIVAGVLILVGK